MYGKLFTWFVRALYTNTFKLKFSNKRKHLSVVCYATSRHPLQGWKKPKDDTYPIKARDSQNTVFVRLISSVVSCVHV